MKKLLLKITCIGSSAMVLPGSHISVGGILGARALLNKKIPEFEIWAGVPAKKIGERERVLDYKVEYKRYFQ